MKLFPRIFLSFWAATILMIGTVLIVTEYLPVTFPGYRERFLCRNWRRLA
jgi:hypothetical protein